MTQTDLSFEQALSELQRVVAELESDDGNLEASLARYERGVTLIRHCNNLLDQAELRMRELLPTGQEVDFVGPMDSRP